MPKKTPAQMRATKKYDSKAYDQITIRVPKGKKDEIQKAADMVKLSLNAYICKSVEKTLNDAPETVYDVKTKVEKINTTDGNTSED